MGYFLAQPAITVLTVLGSHSHGTYRCGQWPPCPCVTAGPAILLPNAQQHRLQTQADCTTRRVTYLMTCQRHVKSLRTYRKSHKYLCILPVRFVNSHSTVIRMEKYWQLLFSSMPHRNITITKTTWNFIRTNFAIVPTFYSLPKIYKDACNPPPPW